MKYLLKDFNFRISLITLLILFLPVTLIAAPQDKRININKAEKIEAVLDEIESQTNYLFIYKDDVDVTSIKSINVKNATIHEVLTKLFAGTSVKYKIDGNHIILTKEEQTTDKSDKITGIVLDEGNEPIVGASVIIKGTNIGSVTDLDGKFAINANVGETLQFNCISYVPQEIKINSTKPIAITMIEDHYYLDEVVLIGYGTAKNADLTGQVSYLSGDKLNAQSNPNLSAQLQGQIAGVQVTRNSGDPSASSSILIHGVTTMSDSSPLVIIDGIPGTLDDVDPSEVQSIQVLKDAASAAIYGARAAAGVILVNTKRARHDKFTLSYNYEYGIDKPTELPEYVGTEDYMKVKNELAFNDGASSLTSVYSPEYIQSYMANHALDPDGYPYTDWQSILLNDHGTHQRHNLTVSGGTKKLSTLFSLNYFTSESVIPGKSYDRIYARVNNDYAIADWIHAKIDMNVRMADKVYPNSPVYYTHYSNPLTAAVWSNGLMAPGRDGENPYALLTQSGEHNTRGYGFTGKIGLDITPIDGLTLSAVAAPTFYLYKSKNFSKSFNLYDQDGNIFQNSSTTNVREDRNDNNSYTLQFFGNYQKVFGKHSLNLTAGYEEYAYNWENEGAWRNSYVLSSYPYLNNGPADQQYNSGNAGHNSYRSAFGRIIYSFGGRYLLQANVRTDGSSRFKKGPTRWGTFPSVSVGWVISEEPWLKGNHTLNFLKLRASIGQLGNERIGSEFPYQAALEFGTAYLSNNNTGIAETVQTAYQSTYAFENITWETTTTYGVGLDAQLFNNRLRFNGDWYYKMTDGMLLTMNFPMYTGFNAPEQNAGMMHTNGWELSVSWNDTIGDFNYGASFNLSDYRSKMGYLGDLRKIGSDKITEEGSYFQEWYLYKSKGIFLNDEALFDSEGNKVPVRGKEAAGFIQSEDIDGDGKITADKDKIRSGNSLPEYQYGASFFASWRGLEFNLALQGIGHWLQYVNPTMVRPLQWGWSQVPAVIIGNHWDPNNTDEQNANARFPLATWNNQALIYESNDFWLYDAAFLRIKDITLGYNIPQSISKKFLVNNLKLYFSLSDLPAIRTGKGYIPGWDPEYAEDKDYITTSYIFGVKVTF